MSQMFRQTGRSLRKHFGFSTVVVLTLALGHRGHDRDLQCRPPCPARSSALSRRRAAGPDLGTVSGGAIRQLFRRRTRSTSTTSKTTSCSRRSVPTVFGTAVLTETGDPLRITVSPTTSSLWRVLRVEAQVGRTYAQGEDEPGSEPLAVLSHGLWHRRFSADPDVVGQTMILDGIPRTVIGVMPAAFSFPDADVDAWLAYPLDPTRRNNHHLYMVGRMRDGVTLAQIEREMDVLANRWQKVHEHWHAFRATSYQEEVLGPVRGPLTLLFAAVGFVLMIACCNVAGLLLARAARAGSGSSACVRLSAPPVANSLLSCWPRARSWGWWEELWGSTSPTSD